MGENVVLPVKVFPIGRSHKLPPMSPFAGLRRVLVSQVRSSSIAELFPRWLVEEAFERQEPSCVAYVLQALRKRPFAERPDDPLCDLWRAGVDHRERVCP